jgi:type VI secretion system protein ImpL
MTIASGLIKLRYALQDLRRQRFMAQDTPDDSTGYQRRYQHRVRSVVVWDQEILRDVLALTEQYETFAATRSYEHADEVDNSVKEAARAQAKLKIRRLIMRARKYEALAPTNEGSALRASLITEVQRLELVKPTLAQVLEASGRLGIDRELRAMLAEQGNSLVRNIDHEFVSLRFYITRQGDFAWWQGNGPVSYRAFDLGSSEELEEYLNFQRKTIAYLGRELVLPVQAFFASQGIPLQRGDTQVDWDRILADLDQFENKTPGNPISSLESFIRTDIDRVSVDSCTGVARVFDNRSTDYFLRIRNSLRQAFYSRCTELGRSKAIIDTLAALENYRKIEESFNDNLRNGFPFGDVNGTQIDPLSLTKFFEVVDLREKAAREALERSENFGAVPKPALNFLKQAVKLREFFAPFLEKKQGPAFDFKVQFRVQPEQPGMEERGGNQIIDWQLEVGKKNFTYRGEDLNGRWVYGDPIRLTLRWANDSPARPIASLLPVPFAVKDRTAIFEYTDRWALFRFLLKHGFMLKRAGTEAECDQGLDPEPYTLKFTIKTGPDPAGLPGQRQDLQSTQAEVFMRVTLLTANKPEPLMIPCFPVKAPPVPSLFVVDRTTATNKDD